MIESCFENKDKGLPKHDSGEGPESPEEMASELESLNREIANTIPNQSEKLKKRGNPLH